MKIRILGPDALNEGPKLGWNLYESPFGIGENSDANQNPIDRDGFVSWQSIPILECLTGKAWDDTAKKMLGVLRPSEVRVIKHKHPLNYDSAVWRVTVFLNEDNLTINKITQEVEIQNGVTTEMFKGNY